MGWYADLWFPIVQRDALNLATDVEDELVHATLVGLVRRGLLAAVQVDEGNLKLRVPEWRPTVEALAQAKAKVDMH